MAPARWGDDADDSSDDESRGEQVPTTATTNEQSKTGGGITVPPTHTSRIDSKGIKIVTSYRLDPSNPNRLLKTTTKIRVTNDKVKENVAVAGKSALVLFYHMNSCVQYDDVLLI